MVHRSPEAPDDDEYDREPLASLSKLILVWGGMLVVGGLTWCLLAWLAWRVFG